MDLESVGIGGGSGIFGAILAYLGFKQRMDANDRRVEILEAQVVYKDSHAECSAAWHRALESIDKKLDILLTERNKGGG